MPDTSSTSDKQAIHLAEREARLAELQQGNGDRRAIQALTQIVDRLQSELADKAA